jgi:hypothetical protein
LELNALGYEMVKTNHYRSDIDEEGYIKFQIQGTKETIELARYRLIDLELAHQLALSPNTVDLPVALSNFYGSCFGYIFLNLSKVGDIFLLVESIARISRGNLLGYQCEEEPWSLFSGNSNDVPTADSRFIFRFVEILQMREVSFKVFYSPDQSKFTSIEMIAEAGVYLLGPIHTSYQGKSRNSELSRSYTTCVLDALNRALTLCRDKKRGVHIFLVEVPCIFTRGVEDYVKENAWYK